QDGAPHPTRAVVLAMAASLAFGVSLYATARAGAELPVSWVVLSARAIGAVTLALPLAAARRLEITRPAVPLVLASGVCEVLGFGPGGRGRALGQPHHARVVAEVVLAELGVAIEAELAPHRVLERAGQEVGEEVRTGLLLQRGTHLRIREHVVAILAVKPRKL